CERPRVVRYHLYNARFELRHCVLEVSIRHPCDTEDSNCRHHTRFEDHTVWYVTRVSFGCKKNDTAEAEHHHLNDNGHANWLRAIHNSTNVWPHRDNDDNQDRSDEQQHRVASTCW
ncbi:hypothetical protein D041_0318B, partial [Vibrio parahaemolyticus EKP-008]